MDNYMKKVCLKKFAENILQYYSVTYTLYSLMNLEHNYTHTHTKIITKIYYYVLIMSYKLTHIKDRRKIQATLY